VERLARQTLAPALVALPPQGHPVPQTVLLFAPGAMLATLLVERLARQTLAPALVALPPQERPVPRTVMLLHWLQRRVPTER